MMATAGLLELGHQLEGGVRVVQVVVAQLLALELGRGRDAGPGVGAADVEGGRLMGVLAVAERLAQAAGDGDAGREGLVVLAGEPLADRGVVGCRAGIGRSRQPAAERQGGGAVVGVQFGQDRFVLGSVGQHGDEAVVLGGAADHRRAADVDVLDAVLERSAARHGRLERVEVDHDQIDRRDVVGLHGGQMAFQVAAGQDAAMDARVQRLDAAVHHLGEAGIVADFGHRHAGVAKLLGGTAGREDLDAARGERLTERNEPGLVGNGNEGSCDADEIGGHDGGILRKAMAEFQGEFLCLGRRLLLAA